MGHIRHQIEREKWRSNVAVIMWNGINLGNDEKQYKMHWNWKENNGMEGKWGRNFLFDWLEGKKVDGKWQGITWYHYFEFWISSSFTHRAMLPLKHALFSSKWYEKHASIIKKKSWGDNGNICLIAWQTHFIRCASRETPNWIYIYVLVIIRCCLALPKQTFNLHRCVIFCRVSRVWWKRFTKILRATRELWSWNSIYVLWKECPSSERSSNTVEGLTLGQLLPQMISFGLVAPYDRI